MECVYVEMLLYSLSQPYLAYLCILPTQLTVKNLVLIGSVVSVIEMHSLPFPKRAISGPYHIAALLGFQLMSNISQVLLEYLIKQS